MVNYTPAELAEELKATERQVHEWRKQHGWPCIKINRTIRFTDEHRAEIIRRHTVTEKAEVTADIVIEGQTSRSAKRGAA